MVIKSRIKTVLFVHKTECIMKWCERVHCQIFVALYMTIWKCVMTNDTIVRNNM